MKNLKLTKNALVAVFFATAMSFSLTSCDDDDDDVTPVSPAPTGNVIVSGNITSDVTWTKDKVYQLASRIAVEDGATLTIQAGTIIKGQAGSGPNATVLVIARGGKLMAEGTAQEPIIFTSVADEIQPGQIASPNMDPTLQGLWGGVIVLGKAPCSLAGGILQTNIEGIPETDPNGLYGGTVSDDNSGVIKFISIRHGGSNIGEGNEINGLTMGGVGSGTVIENVEIVANVDDGLEWFGGTVSVKNAIVWNSGDDALDADQAWAGTMDNFVIICGSNTDHALEIDGPEGPMRDGHIFRNGTVKGSSVAELADFRDGAEGTFENIYFFGFPSPADDGRGDFSLSGPATNANFASGVLIFNNLETTLPAATTLADVFKNGTDVHATEVTLATKTVGADLSKFAGWSWTAVSGQLDF